MWYEIIYGIENVQTGIIPLLIAGLAVAGAGMIGSAVKNAEAKRKLSGMQQQQADRAAENKAWYRSSQAEDYLQTAEAQRILKNQRDALDRERKITTNSAAVTGATPGAVAASKAASTRSMATTLSNLAALGDQTKARKEAQYFAREDGISGRQLALDQASMALTQQEAQNFNNLTQQGLKIAGSAAGGGGVGAAGSAAGAAGAAGAASGGVGGKLFNGNPAGSYGLYRTTW
jgi:hypothetical protein